MAGANPGTLSIALGLTVVGSSLAVWSAAKAETHQLAERMQRQSAALTDRLDSMVLSQQITRDAVMVLKGQVQSLSESQTRIERYLERMDERYEQRIRSLEEGK